MRRTALSLAFLALAQGAIAQGASPDWEKEFAKKYAPGGYAILGNDVYSFGIGSKSVQWTTGRYMFVRCGGIEGLKILNAQHPLDAIELRKMQIVNPGSPGYNSLHEQYKSSCWSKEALESWGKVIKDWANEKLGR